MRPFSRTIVILAVAFSAVLQAGQPGVVSVTPSFQSSPGGVATSFTFTVSDTAGTGDLQGMNILFSNSAPSADQTQDTNACWISYDRASNVVSIYRNGNWSSGAAGGASPDLMGQLCQISLSQSSVASSGSNLSLTIPITFSPNLNGYASSNSVAMPVYLGAVSATGGDTGLVPSGIWTITPGGVVVPDYTISLAPAGAQYIVPGGVATYTVTIAGVAGFNGNVALNPAVTRFGQNVSDPIVTFNPPVVSGSGVSMMTVFTSNSTPVGPYQISVAGDQGTLAHTANATVFVDNAAPTVTVSPDSGSGSNGTFTFSATDLGSADEISGMNILMNTSLNGQGACWMWFDAKTNAVSLANDDASNWSSIQAGSASQVQNSQCSIGGAGVSVQSAHSTGNDLSLQIAVTFKPGFAGTKLVFARAANGSGFDSGYQQVGSWIVQ